MAKRIGYIKSSPVYHGCDSCDDIMEAGEPAYAIFDEVPQRLFCTVACAEEALGRLARTSELHEIEHQTGNVMDDRVCDGLGCPLRSAS